MHVHIHIQGAYAKISLEMFIHTHIHIQASQPRSASRCSYVHMCICAYVHIGVLAKISLEMFDQFSNVAIVDESRTTFGLTVITPRGSHDACTLLCTLLYILLLACMRCTHLPIGPHAFDALIDLCAYRMCTACVGSACASSARS